jgi:hypothetical protein
MGLQRPPTLCVNNSMGYRIQQKAAPTIYYSDAYYSSARDYSCYPPRPIIYFRGGAGNNIEGGPAQ